VRRHSIALRALAIAPSLALALAPTPGCGESRSQRPQRDLDVILIVVDTLRADHVGAFGYGRPTTPHIDALAARGVRFADATSQASWTAPSMVSLFQSRHVVSEFVRMPEAPTLAERLRAAGYRTAGFQDNILLAPGNGFERGFDSYDMEMGPVRYREVLGTHDGRPLFAYFHFVDPHDPYAPIEQFDVFEPETDADLRERFLAYLLERSPDAPRDELESRAARAADEAGRLVALYDGDVLQADRRVQFVMEVLEESGRLQRSLVILTADHGECLWDHREAESVLDEERRADPLRAFKMTHNTLVTEELLHVPLIMAGPGLPAGRVVQQPVENVDIVPTVLDLLGLPVPDGLDGASLVPEIEGQPGGRGRDRVYANTMIFSSSRARDGRKLVLPWDEAGPDGAHAFRLATDPRERQPLPPGDPAFDDLHAALGELRATGLAAQADEALVDDETRRRLEQLGYVHDGH
jgi:arylsulfatase A-like enzyme